MGLYPRPDRARRASLHQPLRALFNADVKLARIPSRILIGPCRVDCDALR